MIKIITIFVLALIALVILTCPLVVNAIFKKIKRDEKDKRNKPRIGWKK